MAGFLATAMKALRTPGMMENLGDFHNALILHLMFLDAKHADGRLVDDFDISFREATRKYLEFLKSVGVELEIPELPTVITFDDPDSDFSKARKS